VTPIRLFSIREVLEVQVVPSEEVKISPHKSICYARMRILLGGCLTVKNWWGVTHRRRKKKEGEDDEYMSH